MVDNKKYEEAAGLNVPLEDANERYAHVAKEEVDASGKEQELIPEGQLDLTTFKKKEIRRVFHNDEWWFSVIDVMAALTGNERPSKYWDDLKRKLIEKEGFSEISDNIGNLPMPGADGRKYRTDAATTETLLRIIQSIRSPPLNLSSAGSPKSAMNASKRFKTLKLPSNGRSCPIRFKVGVMTGLKSELDQSLPGKS